MSQASAPARYGSIVSELPPTEAGGAVDRQAELIGAHVRAVRRAQGLTLVRLAALSGLSHSFLSQLERGQARPSMVSLERIARALGRSQAELLAAADERPDGPPEVWDGLLRAGEGARTGRPTLAARLLSRGVRGFEPMEFSGRNRDPGPYYCHDADELVYVVAGSILIDLGPHGTRGLGRHDSLHYPAGTPHRWSSPKGSRYRLLVVKQSGRVR